MITAQQMDLQAEATFAELEAINRQLANLEPGSTLARRLERMADAADRLWMEQCRVADTLRGLLH